MLDFLRGKRLDMKTSVVILLVIVALWAVVIYANVQDFIPAEFQEATEETG